MPDDLSCGTPSPGMPASVAPVPVRDTSGWSRAIRDTVVAVLLASAGFVMAYLDATAFTMSSPAPDTARFVRTPRFMIWVLILGAEAALLAITATPVLQSYRTLAVKHRVAPSEKNRLLALAITLSVLFPRPTLLYLRQTGIRVPLDHFILRMGLAYPLLLVVAVPSTMGMMLLRLVASIDDPEQDSSDEKTRLELQMELQWFLRRFLAVVGGVLTLGILGVGALFQAYNAYNATFRPQIEQTPTELLLVLGGIWAGVVAGLYLPAQAAIERRGRTIVDGLCPLPAVASPAFAGDLDRRERLSGLLGLGGTPRSRLEDGILILSPLIGGILSSFLGGS